MEKVTFLNPGFFWLFLLLPFAIAWHFWKKNQNAPTLTVSAIKGFEGSTTLKIKLRPILIVLRMLALSAIIIAMARPRTVDISNQTKITKGIDIVMAIDVSGSMLAKDLKPNRMEALKDVAEGFVSNRPNDRIGLVVYASEAYTKTPVTSDKAIILEAIKGIKYDRVLQDGTGIGMGLTTAVNRLKDSKAKSKVVILLTDGVNNNGFIEPETASDIAREFGIKVYTIGIGTNGNAEFPYAIAPNGTFLFRMMPVEIDEKLLKSIAKNTGGKYFRATSNSKLEAIYNEINKLETTEIEELKFYDYDEKFRPFALLAFMALIVEFGLRKTIFKSFI
ncbi:aerotolerance regulator BatA [Flavobacterium branchiophilum NBRC 15030 = ATCC 35035]|uniref:BatA protein n=2 Tax=Flavobacterium branchiophilum TaxID=55197 RepID=G2Z0B5_FLABF|nr:VWA domain-containing protein [Flavobacterium branchiophilum]OXA79231.1 aerotolerance regulator BatA [Flavobacterium branchiophilum NBRC 15030 = ATCC 35035]PDS22826.1 aerotolerance regulator BatA [Flavobacterium branchiophilum]TQM40282.1 Ca-activated chloride channel family protein [Flavobacterium branchiophilum]CCB70890.1 BatA protein [Flavobacterium branchiophilum FL-15]GEM53979.1 BatA protein [Flavobacterium branchiophilum NBRC 15030 = ATCC 35035]